MAPPGEYKYIAVRNLHPIINSKTLGGTYGVLSQWLCHDDSTINIISDIIIIIIIIW